MTKNHPNVGLPEFVPNYTIDQEVCSGYKAKEDMGNISKEMVPGREAFSKESFSYTWPGQNKKITEPKYLELPDSVNNNDVIHHDDYPGEATDNEYDGNHNKNNGQALLAFTTLKSN